MKYFFLANWEDIKYEISCSNVIQRDNVLFAKKLDKTLVGMAKETDKEVMVVMMNLVYIMIQAKSNERLWTVSARRAVLTKIMEEWLAVQKKEPTVRRLMRALSVPEFMDVKLRVETLLERNCEDLELNVLIQQLS